MKLNTCVCLIYYCTDDKTKSSESDTTKTGTEQADQTLSSDKQPDQSTSGDLKLWAFFLDIYAH